MKRLLGLLLVMGMVGCGGGDEDPPAGEAALQATPKTSQAKVNEPSVESAAADPSVASESVSPTTPADTDDDTPAPAADVDPSVESASVSQKTPADAVDDTPAQAADVDPGSPVPATDTAANAGDEQIAALDVQIDGYDKRINTCSERGYDRQKRYWELRREIASEDRELLTLQKEVSASQQLNAVVPEDVTRRIEQIRKHQKSRQLDDAQAVRHLRSRMVSDIWLSRSDRGATRRRSGNG